MSPTRKRKRAPDIDLGDDHLLFFVGWHPDRALNPQYDGIEDVEKYCAIIEHTSLKNGLPCSGAVTLAGETQQRIEPDQTTWNVISWDPFHIEPSVLCDCGDHGFIRDGRWVRA